MQEEIVSMKYMKAIYTTLNIFRFFYVIGGISSIFYSLNCFDDRLKILLFVYGIFNILRFVMGNLCIKTALEKNGDKMLYGYVGINVCLPFSFRYVI